VTLVTASIDIDAPSAAVWDVVMDPHRFADWVTIHRRINRTDDGAVRPGYEVEQTLVLRGAPFKVRWRLATAEAPHHATWDGRGPGGSHARTTYALAGRDGGGTRFDYTNEFRPPGGFIGAAAGHALVGGISQREAARSLERLKALLERSGAH
jgi:carbon monoxide dehydrogenase subunit G